MYGGSSNPRHCQYPQVTQDTRLYERGFDTSGAGTSYESSRHLFDHRPRQIVGGYQTNFSANKDDDYTPRTHTTHRNHQPKVLFPTNDIRLSQGAFTDHIQNPNQSKVFFPLRYSSDIYQPYRKNHFPDSNPEILSDASYSFQVSQGFLGDRILGTENQPHTSYHTADTNSLRREMTSSFQPYHRFPYSKQDAQTCKDVFHSKQYTSMRDRLSGSRESNMSMKGKHNRLDQNSPGKDANLTASQTKELVTLETAERNWKSDQTNYAKRVAHMFDDATRQIIIPAPSRIKVHHGEHKHHTHGGHHHRCHKHKARVLNEASGGLCHFDENSYLVRTMQGPQHSIHSYVDPPRLPQNVSNGRHLTNNRMLPGSYIQNNFNQEFCYYPLMGPRQMFNTTDPDNYPIEGGSYFQLTGIKKESNCDSGKDLLQQACMESIVEDIELRNLEDTNVEEEDGKNNICNVPELLGSDNVKICNAKQTESLDIPQIRNGSLPENVAENNEAAKTNIKMEASLLESPSSYLIPIEESEIVQSLLRLPGDEEDETETNVLNYNLNIDKTPVSKEKGENGNLLCENGVTSEDLDIISELFDMPKEETEKENVTFLPGRTVGERKNPHFSELSQLECYDLLADYESLAQQIEENNSKKDRLVDTEGSTSNATSTTIDQEPIVGFNTESSSKELPNNSIQDLVTELGTSVSSMFGDILGTSPTKE